jgi:hypothetical protein
MTGFWISVLFLLLGVSGYRVMDRADRFLKEHVTREETEDEPENENED